MGTQMLQRRGTDAEWAAANPILGDGEFGYDRNTDEVRIGDGVTRWADLPPSQIYIPQATQDLRFLNRNIIDAPGDLLVGDADNSATRLPKGTAGQRLTIQNDGTLAWVDLPPAANPFTAIDALGDILVGSGPDAVAKLPKGANGSILTIDNTGAVVWAPAGSAAVAKTGDTMTGTLKMRSLSAIRFSTGAADLNSDAQVLSDAAGNKLIVRNGAAGYIALDAGAIYDNGNRVYSASNPPPPGGMMILAEGKTSAIQNEYWSLDANGDWRRGSTSGPNLMDVAFVAPATGKVKITWTFSYSANVPVGVRLTSEGYPLGEVSQQVYTYAEPGPYVTSRIGLTPGATYWARFFSTSMNNNFNGPMPAAARILVEG